MITFVSDLHLGAGDKSDDFSRNAKTAFLNMRFHYASYLDYIVGDLFDTDKNLTRTLNANKDVLQSMSLKPPVIIPGNHDGDIYWLEAFGFDVKPMEYMALIAGQRTIITHGHQFDRFNKPGQSIGKIATRIVSFLERHVDQDIDEKLVELADWIDDKLWKYEIALAAMAKESGCTQVIYGHTHQPGIKRIDGITIANCGTWTRKFKLGYPVLVAKKELELRWVDDHGGIKMSGR